MNNHFYRGFHFRVMVRIHISMSSFPNATLATILKLREECVTAGKGHLGGIKLDMFLENVEQTIT